MNACIRLGGRFVADFIALRRAVFGGVDHVVERDSLFEDRVGRNGG